MTSPPSKDSQQAEACDRISSGQRLLEMDPMLQKHEAIRVDFVPPGLRELVMDISREGVPLVFEQTTDNGESGFKSQSCVLEVVFLNGL
ncbi:unnamed protein product [Timema podura]|uniref:PilZ domain-containing protein n=1 Tax=Timema podura TaxID=61482 RepID=A0ABN7P741_TIMPD|nr:unnamed protein product [Timema podura]